MGIELKIRATAAAPLMDVLMDDADRRRRIVAMAGSLIEMFGESALSVAEGQTGDSDVAGDSGIRWRDIAEALRQH